MQRSSARLAVAAAATPERDRSTRPARAVGRLTGWSAAIVGVSAAGGRPWELLLVIAFVVAFASVVNSKRTTGRTSLRITLFDLLCVSYFGWSVLADTFDSRALHYSVGTTVLLAPAWSFVGYLAARMVVRNKDDFLAYISGFVIPATLNALLAIGQTFSPAFAHQVLRLAPSDGLDTRLTGARLIRATGLIGHWTGLGFYFCAILAMLGCAVIVTGGFSRLPASYLVCAAAVTIGALTTLTFTVIFCALLIVIVIWVVLGIRAAHLVGLIGVGAIGYIVFGSVLSSRISQQTAQRPSNALPSWVPNTLNYRWRVWTQQTVPAIRKRELLGWGTNVYTDATGKRLLPPNLVWKSPESQYLFAAISYGVLAAVLLGVILLVVLGVAWRGRRRGAPPLAAVVALTIGVIVGATTGPILTNHGLPVPFFALIGAAFAAFLPSRYGYGDEPVPEKPARAASLRA